ncbi:cation diffusion facilitator family transporter [uncultured Alistipes sp.]|uniref:cation diffusion facilitator family transporter n=1 Tax=uncultured Alistipes sp. TaxID=538949 RepID=UPI0025FC45D0|nr:cation diffusion facilitator family transporter [uncultured Alistipes sp.]
MESRDKILIRASWVSTIGNTVLSAAKIIIGFTAGSLAVLGDGIDSATDVVISIVMICTAQIMKRPPSKKFVYGFDKAEGIATKVLSLVIFYAGIQMLISSVQSIFSSEPKEIPAAIAIYVTLFSIAGKLLLSMYQYRQGRKINSSLLMANAANMRNDVIISVGVLAGLAFTFVLKLPVLDSITGLVVSIFILRSAISIFLDSYVGLMDGVKDTKIYDMIFEAVEKVPGAGHPHRVRSRMIGNLYMIALDIEVDPDITVSQGHEIAEAVEKSIKDAIKEVYDIVVHIEPAGKPHSGEKYGVEETL